MKDEKDKKTGQFEDWSFDDVFAASGEQKSSDKEVMHSKEKENRTVSSSNIEIKTDKTQTQPVPPDEDSPELQEFSDTKKHSLNRLKPEIKLTSVEESIRVDNRYEEAEEEEAQELYSDEDDYEYDDENYEDGEYEYEGEAYDDEYDYEDTYDEDGYAYDEEYEDEYEDDDYEYDDENYDDGDYEYEDGEYEDEEYSYDDEYDYEESEEASDIPGVRKKDTDGKNKKPLIIEGISIGAVLLLIMVIVLLFKGLGSGDQNSDQSMGYDLQQLTGVVTGVDKNNETILIYNAESKQEQGFTLKDAGQNVMSLGSVNVGDVVELQYNKANGNRVEALNRADNAQQLKDVKNAVPMQNTVTINGSRYSIDDKLVCLYGGQAFDVKKISENTTYDATVVGDHIYTIRVTYATGTLILQNLEEYMGGTIVLQPAVGDKIEKIITPNMEPIELQEGSVEIQIKMENEVVYTGKIFISAGKDNTLKLTNMEDKKGKVVFVSNASTRATIEIDGKQYAENEEIELEYGDYTAHVSASGYDSVDQNFTVSQPYQQVNIEFRENTTQVTVSTNLWGVSLYVDGVYQGELEDSSITCRLSPGTYTVTCTRTGYYDKSTTITITEGMEDQFLYFSGFVPIESNEPSSSQPEPPAESSEEQDSSEEENSDQEANENTDTSTPEDGE